MIQLNAATRLKAAMSQDVKDELIKHVMKECKCDHATAKHYLEDEEWDDENAIINYRGDQKLKKK